MHKKFLDKITCKHGVYNILKNDSYVCKSLINYGEWSELEIDLYKDIVKNDDIIIEVGSHLGSHTLPLAKIAKDGHLYAFEPQLLIFELLKKNLKENNIFNTKIYLEAVSSKQEKIILNQVDYENYYLSNDEINSGGIDFRKLISDKNGYEVNVVTLDNKFEKLEKLNFIKIDAEGNEFEILKGCKNLINKFSPIIYFEYSSRQDPNTLESVNFLDSLDYVSYSHVTPLFTVDNFNKNKVNIFSTSASFMILSIPIGMLDTALELILIKNNCKKIIRSKVDKY